MQNEPTSQLSIARTSMTIVQLFFFFFRISAVTFGGGIVILGMVKLGIAERQDISEGEFSDMVSLAASVPGPLAVSIAWLLGRYYRGLKGSMAAVAGAVLPPFVIILILSPIILKYSGTPEVQGFLKVSWPVRELSLQWSYLTMSDRRSHADGGILFRLSWSSP